MAGKMISWSVWSHAFDLSKDIREIVQKRAHKKNMKKNTKRKLCCRLNSFTQAIMCKTNRRNSQCKCANCIRRWLLIWCWLKIWINFPTILFSLQHDYNWYNNYEHLAQCFAFTHPSFRIHFHATARQHCWL